jgi:putative ABC transport system permease protein
MILSTFGIVLGVAAILAIGITNQTALDSVTNLLEDTAGKADLVITSADADEDGFGENILPRIEKIPGIAFAVPSVQLQTLLADEVAPSEFGISFFGMEMGGLNLYGIDPINDHQVRDYTIVVGEFLSPDLNAHEVVLVESFALEKEIQIGDSIEIITEGGIEKLRVVGLMAKEGPGQLNNGAFGVLPLVTAQKYFYLQDFIDQIDLVASPELSSSEELEDLRLNIQAYLGEDYAVIYPASQGRRMTQMLANYQIGLNFLSGMALFVGAFLIYNAFSMTVVERTREFGMLRTIGMTRAQVTRQVLAEATLLGVFGSLIGLGLGILMARGLTRLMEVMLAQDMTNVNIPRDIVATGAVVGIVVAILAAALPAFQAGRISPLEAMRVRAGTRQGWFLRFGWLPGIALLTISAIVLIINPFPYDVQFRIGSMVVISLFIGGTLIIPISVSIWERFLRPFIRLLFGRSGRIGSSNVERAKLRTTLTVAALMIGVAMIVIVWAMTGSFKGDLDEWLQGYMGGDLYITSSLPMGRDVWIRLQSVEGVAAVAPVRYFEIEWQTPSGDAETLTYMAVDPASYSHVTSFVYSQADPNPQQALEKLATGDTIFISSVLAEKYGLQLGDQLAIKTRTGYRDFLIAAIVVDYYNQGMVIDGSWVDMSRYFRQKDANAYLINVEDGYSISAVQDRIDKLYGKRDRLTIISNQSLFESISVLMEQAFSMFDVLALIAMMVGFFGIANTLTMNVIERTQEIGMLRGVGMTRSQVVLMILAEAALMGLIGGILGIVFGIVLSRIFMMAMTTMSGYTLTYILPMERIIAAMVIAVIISLLAAFLPAFRAARIRILEAIQYE